MPKRGPTSLRSQTDLSETIAQGHDAELVARTLTGELDKRRAEIEKEVFQHLAGSEALSGDRAVQAWLELYAVHRLEQRLRRSMKLGEAAGTELTAQLETPGEPSPRPRKPKFPHT
jgi:hypothetical protein